MDDLLADAFRQLLVDQCTTQVVRQIEAGQAAQSLWQLIENAGFADALVSEDGGGAGLTLSELYPVLELCGAYALPLPLAETVLARAFLAKAGALIPRGSITFGHAATDPGGRVVCDNVRNGRVADWVLVSRASHSLLLPAKEAKMSEAGFCLDATMEWSANAGEGLQVDCTHDVRTVQACVYAAQLAGALMTVFSRTLQYANDRNQFGRPIGKFQAIQHQLSVISEHAFAARMAAQIGCQSASAMPDRMRVAIAKSRTSEAALEVASLSHSIHGAIGFTADFDLQLFTRRLHLWRQAGGSESYWHDVLGADLVNHHSGGALDMLRATTDIN